MTTWGVFKLNGKCEEAIKFSVDVLTHKFCTQTKY